MCRKITAAAPTPAAGLHRRRPHQIPASDDGGPPRLPPTINGDGAAEEVAPPPPPMRPKTQAPAEQIQGIWYGWA